MNRVIRFVAAFSLVLFGTVSAQVPDFIWAKQGGGVLNDNANEIAVDGLGNAAVVGRFEGTASFGSTTLTSVSNADVFLAKYDTDCNLLWIRHAGGISTGGSNSGTNTGLGITTDGSNNIIATGFYIGTITFGSTTLPIGGANEEMFLVKYDPNGNLIWAKAATGSFSVSAFAVATDNSGNIFVTGSFGHHNFGGNATFGTTILTSVGGGDIFLAKYDVAGNVLWAKRAGSSNSNSRDFGFNVATDADGNAIITGRFEGTAAFDATTIGSSGGRDIFVAKYDLNGNLLWVNGEGGTGTDIGQGVAIDTLGNIFVSGSFQNTVTFGSTPALVSAGDSDIFIVKYDPSGNSIWGRTSWRNWR